MDLGALRASVAVAMNDAQLLDLIAASLGVAFVPQSHGDVRDDIVLRPLAGVDAGSRRVGIAHRKTAFATDIARQLSAACG